MSLRDDRDRRRDTPVDLGAGGGDCDCLEVHALAIPGHHSNTGGTISIVYTIPAAIAGTEEPVTISAEVDHDANDVTILNALIDAAAGEVEGEEDPVFTAETLQVAGGPLPNEVYLLFQSRLKKKTIPLPVVDNELTGSPLPSPIVRKASAVKWDGFFA